VETPDPAALTIESIEHGLTSAGYSRLETGRLSSLAATLDDSPTPAPADPAPDTQQQLTRARALRREGRMGEALIEYRALTKADADQLPDIIRDLRDAAIEDPREPEIPRLLGDALIRMGAYTEALEAHNQANALRQQGE
jgi:hypothetical protein